MKATELAQILYTLDCWGMKDYYAIEKVIGVGSTKRFSNFLEDKVMPAGLYLWLGLNKTEHDTFLEMLRLVLGADYVPFFDQKGVTIYYVAIKID